MCRAETNDINFRYFNVKYRLDGQIISSLECWLLLKEMGVKEYDWGGIASCDESNGIDRFKMSFGGRYNEDYNLYAACSLRAKV